MDDTPVATYTDDELDEMYGLKNVSCDVCARGFVRGTSYVQIIVPPETAVVAHLACMPLVASGVRLEEWFVLPPAE